MNTHLEFPEPVIAGTLFEDMQQNLVRQRVLLGEPVGRDGLQLRQEALVARVLFFDGGQRLLVQLVEPDQRRFRRSIRRPCWPACAT